MFARCLFQLLFLSSLCILVNGSYTDPKAPETYQALFNVTIAEGVMHGVFVIDVTRSWAPYAADRFHALITSGYYDNNAIFRVIPKFLTQWGISSDPAKNELWAERPIPDDTEVHPNKLKTVAFASNGPNSRRTQIFINTADNSDFLDEDHFFTFGIVSQGYDETVAHISNVYSRKVVRQEEAETHENYFETNMKRVDYVLSATIL